MYNVLFYLLMIKFSMSHNFNRHHNFQHKSSNPIKYHLITQQDPFNDPLTTQRPALWKSYNNAAAEHKVRHVSRYKKLDGLIERMSNFDRGSQASQETTTKYLKSYDWNKRQSSANNYKNLLTRPKHKVISNKKDSVYLPHGGASFDEYDDDSSDMDPIDLEDIEDSVSKFN